MNTECSLCHGTGYIGQYDEDGDCDVVPCDADDCSYWAERENWAAISAEAADEAYDLATRESELVSKITPNNAAESVPF